MDVSDAQKENPAISTGLSITASTLGFVVVMFLMMFVPHGIGRNGHPGHKSQTEHCDHQFAKLHSFPLKLEIGRFPADQPFLGYYAQISKTRRKSSART